MNNIKKRSSMLIKALSLMLVMLLALSPTVMAQTRNPVENDVVMSVDPSIIHLHVGETFYGANVSFNQEVSPEEKEVFWHSEDQGVADVDRYTGEIFAIREGAGRILVYNNYGVEAFMDVMVLSNPRPEALTADPGQLFLEPGEIRGHISLHWTPNDLPEEFKTVTWESDIPQIADVDENGKITAYSPGETKVWATSTVDPSIRAEVFVEVRNAPVAPHESQGPTEIIADPESIETYIGDVTNIDLTFEPADLAEELKTVTWESEDPSIATVDANGKVTAVDYGHTNIIVTSTSNPNVQTEIWVHVLEIVANEVIANPDEIELEVGETFDDFNLSFLPVEAIEDSKAVYWWTEDQDIIAVDMGTGRVTALEEGTATMMVILQNGMGQDEILINVVPERAVVPTSIGSIPEYYFELEKGQVKDDIELIFQPENLVEESKTVTWHSEDPNIVTVDQNGKVTAVNYGEASIWITSTIDPDVKHSILVIVPIPMATGVTVTPNPVEVEVGKTFDDLVLTFEPAGLPAESKAVTWEVMSPDVASIDENGKITGLIEGTTEVYVLGAGIMTTFTVNVVPAKPIIELGSSTIKVVQAKRGKITDLSKMLTQNFKITAREYNPATGLWSNVVLNVGAGGNVQMSPTPNLNKVGTYNFNLKLKDSDGNWVDFNNFIIYVM